MYVLLILMAAVTLSQSNRLPEKLQFPDDSQLAENRDDEKIVTKRNASPTSPAWGFIPIFASSPVIQVHHIIHLQQPDSRCLPSRPPSVNPSTGQLPFPPPPEDGLESRFGNTNQTSTVKAPSPCVWAIVSCCSPGNTNIRYSCFELLGCQGAFWDLSPCEPRVVQAAANTALMFYMSASPQSNQSNVIDFDPPESESPA